MDVEENDGNDFSVVVKVHCSFHPIFIKVRNKNGNNNYKKNENNSKSKIKQFVDKKKLSFLLSLRVIIVKAGTSDSDISFIAFDCI